MSENARKIVEIMEMIAPSYLAETWDNVGLQIGDLHKTIHKILVCLEITDSIIDEAVSKKVDMIICHHPLLFQPVKAIRKDNPIGKMIHQLVRHDIVLYCAHTNLDIVLGGTNDILAQILNVRETKPLVSMNKEKYYKLCVYVPKPHVEEVRDALCSTDAGHIGNYSHCTFQIEGVGTFKPLEGTNPFIGTCGTVERVSEYKVETIVSGGNLNEAIENMQKAHPYEEVAYDVIPLKNDIVKYGLGRVGEFTEAIRLSLLCEEIKQKLGMKYIRFVGDANKQIKKIGLCTGSGAEFIYDAYEAGCDCYITGDVKYHDAQYATGLGIAVIDAGHFETENIMGRTLVQRLNKIIEEKGFHVEVILSNTCINPFQTI
ncbi:Nif3-like dinuclear metal center hexameric protein [Clostridiaceae bacterium 35-E11]